MKKFAIIIITGFLFSVVMVTGLNAQIKDSTKVLYSGRLSDDSKIALANYESTIKKMDIEPEGKKSPFLAGLLSAAVPGAGEIYTKNYWKAAAFLAVEAAAIITSVYYNKKGDDATVEFKNYADEHWSPVRYAEWLNKYAADLRAQNAPKIQINYDPNLKPWEQVSFDQIHAVEDKIPTFSHRLERHGEQQYYELIGKYRQYSHGWDAWDPIRKSGGEDAEYLNNPPKQMLDFSEMFLKPDKTYYKYASTAVIVVVVNHILSITDAVWSASRYNKNLNVGMEVNSTSNAGVVDYYPQLNLSYRF
ncbi:MAG: DUF5683 domain-containing protein [Bacillota bacterium]